MYGMGGGGTTIIPTAVTTATTGVVGVTVLPDTGTLSKMFYFAAVCMAVGVVSLIVITVSKFRKNRLSNKNSTN